MRNGIRLVIATVSLLIAMPLAVLDAQVRTLPGASSVGDGIETTFAHQAKSVVFFEDSFGWIDFDAIASEGDGYPGYVVDEAMDWEAVTELVEPEVGYVLDLRRAGVDDSHLKQLAGLKNVFALGLAETRITDSGLWHLRSYTNLEHLDVSGDFVTDNALVSLKAMKNLRQLDLSNTRVTDAGMKTIAQFPALRALRLRGTEVTGSGLADLASLESLEALTIELKAEGIGGLAELVGLTTLNISGSDLGNDDMDVVGQLTKVRVLGLADLPIDDEGLAKLHELDLQSLAIAGTQVRGYSLSGFTNLESLDASWTPIDDQGLDSLVTEKLTLLNLYDSAITDNAIPAIIRQSQLVELGLGRTAITNAGIEKIVEMPELQALNFDGCLGIDNSTVKLLSKMPGLTSLVLSNTAVTNSAIEDLRKFKSLRYLDLSGIQIGRVEFLELMESLPDCQIR